MLLARLCARAHTSLAMLMARSCVCARISPYRPAGCIWGRHPVGNVPARYCYSGSAFRYQPAGATSAHPSEFHQTGIESFAAADREHEDAAVLGLIIEALRETGFEQFQLSIGDLDLFRALLDAVPMPERWRRRLWHHFWRRDSFRRALMRLTSREALKAHNLPHELMQRLDPTKPEEVQSIVEEYLDRSGIELIGWRTLPEIAERLCAAAADAREAPLELSMAGLIDSFTLVRVPAREAVSRLAGLLRPQKIDISASLDSFNRRLQLLDSLGVHAWDTVFSTVFGRNLEYYTGFVFELIAAQLGVASAELRAAVATMNCLLAWEHRSVCRLLARAFTANDCLL